MRGAAVRGVRCGAVRFGVVRRKSGSCLCIAGSAAWLEGPSSEFFVVSFPGRFGAVGEGYPPPLFKALLNECRVFFLYIV